MDFDFADKFIRLWWRCESLEEVAFKIGSDKRTASNIAAHLRRRGVLLPAFPPKRNSQNVRKGKKGFTGLNEDQLRLLILLSQNEKVQRAGRENARVHHINQFPGVESFEG